MDEMNRMRAIGMGLVILCAMAMSAQTHWSTDPAAVQKHVQVLGDKLGLTADQKEKITPMLQQMHDSSAKAEQNQGLSDDERNSQMMAAQKKADQQIRTVLNDEQKKKLDALEADLHSHDGH
jgi:hypothetical protein